MHPVWLLAFATFLLVVAFVVWNIVSTRRNQKTGGHTHGLGGPGDPLSGAKPLDRSANDMQQSLEHMEGRDHATGAQAARR